MVLLLTPEDTEVFTIWFGDANCWAYKNDSSNETCTLVDSIRHYDLFKLPQGINLTIEETSWDPNYCLYNAILLLGLLPDDPLVRAKLQEGGSALRILNDQVEINIECRVYSTSQVVSTILRELARRIRGKHYAFKYVIVVHEFHYNSQQKKCFQKICSELGIKVLTMINCDTAIASDSYLKMSGNRGKTNFLVFNMGYNYRRSAISVIQFDKTGRETQVKVKATEEFFYFFNTKRNELILNILEIICGQLNIPIQRSTKVHSAEWNLANVSHQVALKLYIENLQQLTMNFPSNFLFPFNPQIQEKIGVGAGQISMNIVKNHYDRIYPVEMERYTQMIENLLRRSEIQMNGIDGIILVDLSQANSVAERLIRPVITAQPFCKVKEEKYWEHEIIYSALRLRSAEKYGLMNVFPDDELDTPAIGIDIGTNFITAAFFTKSKVFFQDSFKCSTLSYASSISFDKDGNQIAVGEETIRSLTSSNNSYPIFDMKLMIGKNSDNPEIERLRSSCPFQISGTDNTIKIPVGQSKYSPEELTAKMIVHMKDCIEEKIGKPLINAVLTVPKFFNYNQKTLMKDACKTAGLVVLRVIDESTAAALAYTMSVIQEAFVGSDHFLIFNLGGSTLNVAVTELQNKQIRIKSILENSNLGGKDFDREIFEYCTEQFKEQLGVDLSLKNSDEDYAEFAKRLYKLRVACEEGKIKLSIKSKEKVNIFVERIHGLLDMNVPVTRNIFESRIEQYLTKCVDLVYQVIRNSGVAIKDITKIVLIGGSSKIPKVQQILATEFGREKILAGVIDAETTVARGAAIFANCLENPGNENINIECEV